MSQHTISAGDWLDLGDGCVVIILFVNGVRAVFADPYDNFCGGTADLSASIHVLTKEEIHRHLKHFDNNAKRADDAAARAENEAKSHRRSAERWRCIASFAERITKTTKEESPL